MAKAISIRIEGLDRLKTAFQTAPTLVKSQIQKAIILSVALVNRNAKMEAPVKTGRLRSGILSRLSPFKGAVESTVAYGIYVHEGTSAHIIRPVSRKALYWKGASHPVKSVRHPGTRANPFMKKGAEKSEGQVQLSFQKAVNNVVNHLAR